MRILVVHRYYWPDQPPCAGIMHSVAKHLAADGHAVDVLTSQPSYRGHSSQIRQSSPEQIDGVSITRLLLPTEVGRPIWRIVNALHLGAYIMLRSMIQRYNVIIVATIPPVLGGVFSALAAKLTRARFIYYCMDLHPEIGRLSGDFTNPRLFHLLLRLDDWSCSRAQPVLVHSEDMRNTLRRRTRGAQYRIEVMNNFALPTQRDNRAFKCEMAKDSVNLRLIYAGNMGRFQGLGVVLDAMAHIAHRKDIELMMIGEGTAKPDLVAQQQRIQANVRFLDHQSTEIAKAMIKEADIGIVALVPEMYRYAYPSKTMTYLEQGRPIIAAVEPESELAKTMLAEGYGFSVPIGDAQALAELLVRLADEQSWKEPMSQSASAAFEKYFSASVVLAKWSKLVGSGCS